jgi:hypothetical protein
VSSAEREIWRVVEEACEIVFKRYFVDLEASRKLAGCHQQESDPVLGCFKTVAVAMVVNLVGGRQKIK